MTSADIAQLTNARTTHGHIKLADGRTLIDVTLFISCLFQGRPQDLPGVTMNPAQARSLALLLLTEAEAADPTAQTTPPH